MAVTRPLTSARAVRPEFVIETLRISSAGAIVAPAQGPSATVTVNGTGDHTITFLNPYAELLGFSVQIESAVVPAAGAQLVPYVEVINSFTLRVRIVLDSATAPVVTAAPYALLATFSDSLVP